jgi:hypothetical protein
VIYKKIKFYQFIFFERNGRSFVVNFIRTTKEVQMKKNKEGGGGVTYNNNWVTTRGQNR